MRVAARCTAVALALAVADLPMTASAAGSTTTHFKGFMAEAVFETREGCVLTSAELFLNGLVSHDPPGSARDGGPEAQLALDVFDMCSFTELLSAAGSATLADTDFQADRRLSSATLTTTINIVDFVSGRSFDVSVDLTWKATGPVTAFIDEDIVRQAGTFINYQSIETQRDASPTGTISDGTTNFSPAWATRFGSLKNVISGVLTSH